MEFFLTTEKLEAICLLFTAIANRTMLWIIVGVVFNGHLNAEDHYRIYLTYSTNCRTEEYVSLLPFNRHTCLTIQVRISTWLGWHIMLEACGLSEREPGKRGNQRC